MTRIQELRQRAAELRWRARQPVNARLREELLELATECEALAAERERLADGN